MLLIVMLLAVILTFNGDGRTDFAFSGQIQVVDVDGELVESHSILDQLKRYEDSNSVKAILLNILNPKLTIFFFAFLPQFVDPAAGEPLAQLLLLSTVFMAMTFGVFVAYGVVAHAFRRRLIESPRVQAWLRRGFAAAFAALGARLALEDR